MTYNQIISTINRLDTERFCWFTEDDWNEYNLQFRTLARLMHEGRLIYCPHDNLWFGPETYSRIQAN